MNEMTTRGEIVQSLALKISESLQVLIGKPANEASLNLAISINTLRLDLKSMDIPLQSTDILIYRRRSITRTCMS